MAANPLPSQVTGSVEFSLPWNGDFTLTDTGDIQLSADNSTAPNATIERITRLLLTSPTLFDQNNAPIAQPDDLFHPTWGAGLRAYVGTNFTAALLQQIQAATLQQLRQDPGVAFQPTPIVTVTSPSLNTVTMTVQFWSPQGQPLALPTITISPNGILVGA